MSTAKNIKDQAPAAAATADPEPFDLRSHDLAAEKQEELLRLFPEARKEGGKIDFGRPKLAAGQTMDVGKERYGMNWPGKADCFRTIQTPSVGTLRPNAEESVNCDTTENPIIEGTILRSPSFSRLPSWFKVDTPLGKYNPDWAILKQNGQAMHLVRETKGDKDFLTLRTNDADNVRCGQPAH